MDNKPGFTGDRALPEATAIMKQSADQLYEVGYELKKRPVLREAVNAVARELGEAAEDAWPYALEHADDLAGMERLAREEVAAVAKAHVVRLPSRSGWRRKLMEVGELDHEFAVEKLERRMGEDPEDARQGRRDAGHPSPEVVALGVLLRAVAADLDDEGAKYAAVLGKFADHLDRSGIDAPSKVEDIELAATGNIGLLARHYAQLLPEESSWRKLFADLADGLGQDVAKINMFKALGGTPDDSATDVRVLAEISQDIGTHVEALSEGSRWRAPLKHFADRLLATRSAAGREGAEV